MSIVKITIEAECPELQELSMVVVALNKLASRQNRGKPGLKSYLVQIGGVGGFGKVDIFDGETLEFLGGEK